MHGEDTPFTFFVGVVIGTLVSLVVCLMIFVPSNVSAGYGNTFKCEGKQPVKVGNRFTEGRPCKIVEKD